MNENTITLYPGNWLYNAGVVGFLKIIHFKEEESYISSILNDDGSLFLDRKIFDTDLVKNVYLPKFFIYYIEYLTKDENIEEWLNQRDSEGRTTKEKVTKFYVELGDFGYRFIRGFNKLFRSKMPYQNLVQEGEWKEFVNYIAELKKWGEEKTQKTCNFCSNYTYIEPSIDSKLQKRLFRFDLMHSSLLGPSLGGFPNSFWNENVSMNVCPMCAYLLIHNHLAFIKLSDGSEIFINAPSFKIMWYLNKYAEEIYSKEKIQTTKELLGISLIALASKLYIQLSKWVMMNIEVVSKFNNRIDFFVLPYETVLLLSDRDIAGLLNEIGEFRILNLVLDGNYRSILEIGERIFNIALKPQNNQKESDFINEIIKLQKNKDKKTEFSYKLFKLYSLIEEKLKGGILV